MPRRKKQRKNLLPPDIILDELLALPPSLAKPYLNGYALAMQEDMDNEELFDRIRQYLHKFIVGLAYSRYVVRGHEGKDLYQEGMIALRFKAIPKFRDDRGMSFLNFAKMCIKRHLITILNQARNRKKDQPMNRSVPLDSVTTPGDDDSGDGEALSNFIVDDEKDSFVEMCRVEDKDRTLSELKKQLSDFEKAVLACYLEGHSYRETSRLVTRILGKRYDEKSIDNALLRIRNKAIVLSRGGQELPMFGLRKTRRRKRKS